MSPRKILITAGLPYANGYIHLGHLVEYLQADFWTRFQKMRGHDIAYICGDDTHGTPIMMKARELGISPENLIEQSFKEHFQDFKDFQIEFSHYTSTNSPANRELCEEIFSHMKPHTLRKGIQQLFCQHDQIFLPDRFVKGTCPKCGALDQYGDSCDVCGATYSPDDLKNPACSICGTSPIKKNSEHILFKLNDFKDFLKNWLPKHTSPEITKKMMEWFHEDLRNWDISRDGPYFGFQIPGETNKFFYVWVDAPMGYVSGTKEWCKKTGRDFDSYWKKEGTEIYHLIGKDITYFHTLFWPALLKCAGYRTPDFVFIHGRLMINGEKMSKSKGTMIPARVYLNHLDPQHLRYYYFTKISGGIDDFDLNMEDFSGRVNSELVGKITNLGSRSAQMIQKRFTGKIAKLNEEGQKILALAHGRSEEIAQHFEARDFFKASHVLREIVDSANKYFDEMAPWKSIDTNPEQAHQVLSTALLVFRSLAIYLKPILPNFTANVEKLFGEAAYDWYSHNKLPQQINEFKHLMTRLDPENIKQMMLESHKINNEISQQRKAITKVNSVNPTSPLVNVNTEIEIDDFNKVDLRVAKVISAEAVPEADKLLKLQVELTPGTTKQIFAGIKAAYDPNTLIGRHVLIVANLKPRKMKFGMSEGMVLAAGDGGKDLFLFSPDEGAKAGQRAK